MENHKKQITYSLPESLPYSLTTLEDNGLFFRKHKTDSSLNTPRFTFIDLFAGIGGFRLGLERLGGKCVFSSEWNSYAADTYQENFGERPYGDITSDIVKSYIPQNFDLLSAGFPCQPFSISGRMKGFEDTRGTLIYEILHIMEVHRPKVVLLENVKHLKHHDQGRTLKVILEAISKLGYYTKWSVLNASLFGVPQNRERIIIIASLATPFNFAPLEKTNKTQTLSLEPFLDKDAGQFEYLEEPYTLLEHPIRQQSGLIFAGYRNKKIRTNGTRPGTEHLSRVHKQPNRIYSTEGIHPALPSQESSGRFFILHQGRVRKLTITECYRIMGFPENFKRNKSLPEQYKQIGNSVCVPMVESIITEIIKQELL